MSITEHLSKIRQSLKSGTPSIGSWIQIPHPSIAEILGSSSSFEWIAIDMEHGNISIDQLPNLCRAIELKDTLPLVRVRDHSVSICRSAMDAGAGGLIIPMIKNSHQLKNIIESSSYPPTGKRGVGYCRANNYGETFDKYLLEAQNPLFIAQIESIEAIENLEDIINTPNLDAIMIGPYDLSASLGKPGDFESKEFKDALSKVSSICLHHGFPKGIHVIKPLKSDLRQAVDEDYSFIAFSMDSVMLQHASRID